MTSHQKIKAEVGVRLLLGCDLYTGEYGNQCLSSAAQSCVDRCSVVDTEPRGRDGVSQGCVEDVVTQRAPQQAVQTDS